MTQVKYPDQPITKPQIKKIHTLKSSLKLSDENYEALLFRFGVESSKELNKKEASELIETLLSMCHGTQQTQKKKRKTLSEVLHSNKMEDPKNTPLFKSSTGVFSEYPTYSNRSGKVTDKQILYITNLWTSYAEYPQYGYLMSFIKKVTKKLYMRLEYLDRKEASNVIVALEKWFKIQRR